MKSHLTAANVLLLLQMWIQLEMCLCFSAKNLHLVLIKTFVRAELQLCRSVVEVDVGYGVADIFAEVTRFGALKGRSTPKKEAILRAENCSR
jgi:hypothetical protein